MGAMYRIFEVQLNKKLNMMISFHEMPGENTQKHYPCCPQSPDHPYRILIVGSSGSGKTNELLNLISQQPDIDKILCMPKIHTN